MTQRSAFLIVIMIGSAGIDVASAQAPAAAAAAQAAPPPSTRLEAFHPDAGTVVTFGYNELGRISGVSVDVREIRNARGLPVRGLVVDVMESQYRRERAFVDADEIAELIRGFDAIMAVSTNPTSFTNFEVRYTTRGELELTAFNSSSGSSINYSVQAGRVTRAQVFLGGSDMQRLRAMFVAAQSKLAEIAVH